MTDTSDDAGSSVPLVEVATLPKDTPAKRALKSARKSLDAAKVAADHASDAIRHGREAMPEMTEMAKDALDAQMERLSSAEAAAPPELDDPMEEMRTLIRAQVRERPLASALTAVGIGLVFGLMLRGGRR